MEDPLDEHLAELEAFIEQTRADGVIDDAERRDLARLIEQVREDLEISDSDHDAVAERLNEAAVNFEADHPGVAGAIRQVVHALSGLGL